MNANRYRLIFDKRTGMLVPVAEFTTGAKKGNSPGMGDGMGDTSTPKWNQLCAAVALAAGGLGSGTLNAQIVPDGTTQTTVTRTATDKPLINIANPNASGLSHNKFTQFNADGTGPVFNNSMVDSATSSGGFALKNPHLTRNATGILTEVTGTDISRLQGQMEIHGGAPVDLIIANPNGLYVNGVSLIGGNSLTLTTGKPDAQGRKFEVHGGHVDLRGDISTAGMKYFDVVARSIALSGKVSGGSPKMRLATGLNTLQTLADKYGAVTKRANGGDAGAPVYAIQGSDVGSMHGSHVTLLSTESGVGVRHEGQLISTSDINISADGDLRIRGIDARNSAFLEGDDVSLGGEGATPTAASTRVNYHLGVDARGDMSLAGKHDISKGVFKVGGALTSEEGASVTAVARAYNLEGRIDVRASAFDLLGGTWSATHFLDVVAGDMGVAAGAQLVTSHGTVKVANKLQNAGKLTVNDGGTYDIDVGELVTADKSQIQAAHLWLDAKRLDNAGSITGDFTMDVTLVGPSDSRNTGTLSSTFADVKLTGEQTNLFNSGVIIAADGTMTIRLASLQNLQKIEGKTYVDMVIAQGMENSGAILSEDKIDLKAAWLRNSGENGSISAGSNASLVIAGDVENIDHARILGNTLVTITAGGKLLNADVAAIGGGRAAEGGMPAIEGDLSITATGGLSNIGKGELYGTIVNLTTDGVVLNRDGAEIRGDWTTLTAGGALHNDSGKLRGDKQLDALVGGAITNIDGTLQGGRVILEGKGGLDNTAGNILGSHIAIAVQDDVVNVGKGKIVADDYVHLSGGSIDNEDSLVQGGGNVVVTAKGGLMNTQDGTLAAGKTLDIKTGFDILNDAGHMRGQHVMLDTPGNLTNTNGGTIKADEQLQAKVAGALENANAGTQMTGETVFLDVEKDVVNTDAAVMQASEYLQIKAQALANTDTAKILAGVTDGATKGHMEITVIGGEIVNKDGAHIVATGDAAINARDDILNQQNAKIAGDRVWIGNMTSVVPNENPTKVLNDATSTIDGIDLVSIENRTNLVNEGRIGANDVNIKTAERVDNPGRIVAGNGIWIDTRAIDNTATGTIEAKYLVDMKTIGFKNVGKIFSDNYVNLLIKEGHDLTIDDTAHGPIALERLEIWANDVTINRTLANPGSIKINAEDGFLLNNEGIVSGKSFTGLIGKDFDNRSLVWAAKDVGIEAKNLWNRGQEIEAGENMWIELEGTLLNTDTARIASGGHMALDAQEIQNKATYDSSMSLQGNERNSGSYYGGEDPEIHVKIGYEDRAPCYGSPCNPGGQVHETENGLRTPVMGMTRLTAGEIAAGGTMRINEGTKKGKTASIRNQGDIRAAGSLTMDGAVVNTSPTLKYSIEDYLRRPVDITVYGKWYSTLGHMPYGSDGFESLWHMLDATFDTTEVTSSGQHEVVIPHPKSEDGDINTSASDLANALKTISGTMYSKVMSQVLGPDWRNIGYDVLRTRWSNFKRDIATKEGLTALPDQGPSIIAGGSIFHEGGGLDNGTGSKYLQNQTVTVTIDGEDVETVAGNFDVLRDLKDLTQVIDPSRALEQITRENNKKFRKAPGRTNLPVVEWAKLPKIGTPVVVEPAPTPVHPIYETRFEFIDQNTFYGTDYFFKSIGYVPDRTVTVIGDNFFINELVTRQVGTQVAGFIAVQDKVTGTAMVQKLMDNAGNEGKKLGLQVGIAPTEAQLAGLETDIVWFVEKDVDGVKALVPQVFLSKKTVEGIDERRHAGVAQIEAGELVVIDADETGVHNNDGIIRAGKTMSIESKGKVINTTRAGLKNGGLRAGDDLLIDAKGDVVNIGADIIAGRHGQILTDGDFTDTVRTGYNEAGNLVVKNKGRLRGGGAEEGDSRKVPSFEEKKEPKGAELAGGISTMPAGGANPDIQTGAIANPDAAVISVAGATNVGGPQTLAVGIAPQPSGQPTLAIEAGIVAGGNNKMIQTDAIANVGVTSSVSGGLVSQPSSQPRLAVEAMIEVPKSSGQQVTAVESIVAGGPSASPYARTARGVDGSDFSDVPAPPIAATETPSEPEPAPRESKGSFSIHAKGNIKLTASDIRAQDVSIKAGKDLIVKDVHEVASTLEQQVSKTTDFGFAGRTTISERAASEARSVGARIQGSNDGGMLIMHAEGDVRLQGGEYGADVGSIRGKNVITTTAKDYRHEKSETTTSGFSMGGRAGMAGFGVGGQIGRDAWSGTAVDGKPSGDGNYPGQPGDDGFRGVQDGMARSDGRAVLGETAGGRIGGGETKITVEHSTIKNKNAQLNFVTGVEIKGEDRVDIGGADIRAWKEADGKIQKGNVYIEGGEVVATKFKDKDVLTTSMSETFAGFQGSASSSLVDFANNITENVRNGAEGMGVDPGMMIGSIAGDLSNLAMNDAVGASAGLSFEEKESKRVLDRSKQNVNTVVGNIAIVSKKGDINLGGVVLDGRGAGVLLDSAAKLRLGSGVDTEKSSEESKMINRTMSVGGGVGPSGVSGPGISGGYNEESSRQQGEGTTNTNTLVMGDHVILRSKGDTTLAGANVIGGLVQTDIGGRLEIFSQQDTYDANGSREDWGVTAGSGGSVGGNRGHGTNYEKRRTTGQQSGIVSGHLDLNVKGDLHMKGSHIITQTGTSNVGGKLIAENIHDTIEKDGTYVGGGTSLSVNQLKQANRLRKGKPDADGFGVLPEAGNLQVEKDERHFYDAEQLVTISGIEINAKGGTEGEINTDAENMVRVHNDQRIASSRISATIAPKQMKDMAKGAMKKLRNQFGTGSPQVAPAFTNIGAVAPVLDGAPASPKRPTIGEPHDFDRGTPTPNPARIETPEIAKPVMVEPEPIYATVDKSRKRPVEVEAPTRVERTEPETSVAPDNVVERKPSIDNTPVIVDIVDRSQPGHRFHTPKPVPEGTPVIKVGDMTFIAKEDGNGNLVPTGRYVETTASGELVEAGRVGLTREGTRPNVKQHGDATLVAQEPHRNKPLQRDTGSASVDTRAPKSEPSVPHGSPMSTLPKQIGGDGEALAMRPRPVNPDDVVMNKDGLPVIRKPGSQDPSQRGVVQGDDGQWYEVRRNGEIIGQRVDTQAQDNRADTLDAEPYRSGHNTLPPPVTGHGSAAVDNQRRSVYVDDSSTESDTEGDDKKTNKGKRASKKKVSFEVPPTGVTADVVAQKLAAQGDDKPLYKTVVGIGDDGVEIVEAQPRKQQGGIEAGRRQAELDRMSPLTERVPTQYQHVRDTQETETDDDRAVDSDTSSLQWSDIEAEQDKRLITSIGKVGSPAHFPNPSQQTAKRAPEQGETAARLDAVWAEHDATSRALAEAEKGTGIRRKKNNATIAELKARKDALEREATALMVKMADSHESRSDAEDHYTNRLIVLEGKSPKEIKAANNLLNAHANAVLVDATGSEMVIKGSAKIGGKSKVEVVGENKDGRVGGKSASTVANQIDALRDTLKTEIPKVSVVSCESGLDCGGREAVSNRLDRKLQKRGIDAEVVGYDDKVVVDGTGHKRSGKDDPDALGDNDDTPPPLPDKVDRSALVAAMAAMAPQPAPRPSKQNNATPKVDVSNAPQAEPQKTPPAVAQKPVVAKKPPVVAKKPTRGDASPKATTPDAAEQPESPYAKWNFEKGPKAMTPGGDYAEIDFSKTTFAKKPQGEQADTGPLYENAPVSDSPEYGSVDFSTTQKGRQMAAEQAAGPFYENAVGGDPREGLYAPVNKAAKTPQVDYAAAHAENQAKIGRISEADKQLQNALKEEKSKSFLNRDNKQIKFIEQQLLLNSVAMDAALKQSAEIAKLRPGNIDAMQKKSFEQLSDEAKATTDEVTADPRSGDGASARDQITKTVHERGVRADRYGNVRYGPAQAGPGERLLGRLTGKSPEQVNQDKQARQQQRLIDKRVELANELVATPQKRMTSDGSITVGNAHATPTQRLAGLLRGKSKDQVDKEKTQRQRERYEAWEATNKAMDAHDVLGTSVASTSAAERDPMPFMSETPDARAANMKRVLLLEDPRAAHTVAKLQNQFPGMAIVNVDADNQVRLVSGSIKPGEATSVLVLGHGNPELHTIGQHTGPEVAAHITTLRDDYGIVVGEVDLAVCQADACDANGASVRSNLKSTLANSGIDVNVWSKLGDVVVFEDGQRLEVAPTSAAIANKRTYLMGEWQHASNALAAARAKGEDATAHEAKLMKVEKEIGGLMRGMDARARKDLLKSKGFKGDVVVPERDVTQSGDKLGNEDGASGNAGGKSAGGSDKPMSWDAMRSQLKPTPEELEQEKRAIQNEVETAVGMVHGRMDRFGKIHLDNAKPNALDRFVGRMQGKTPQQVTDEKQQRQTDRLIAAKVREHQAASQKARDSDLGSIAIAEMQERRDLAAQTLDTIKRGPLANTPEGMKARFKTEQALRHFDSRLGEMRLEQRVRVLDQGAALQKTRLPDSGAFQARNEALRKFFQNDAATASGSKGARNDTFEGDDGVDNEGQPKTNEPIYQNWSDAAMRRVGHEDLPLDVRHAIANLPSLKELDFVDGQGNARLPMLLRGDDRAPGLMFAKGMQAREVGKSSTAGSVLHHVHGNKKAGMVSTTKSGPVAASIADDGAGGYVYVVLGKDGVDVNKWMEAEGRQNLYGYEQEVLVDGIDGSHIVGAYRVNRGGQYAKDSFIPNPNFRAAPVAPTQSNADNTRAPASSASKASNDDNGDGDDNGGGDGNGRSRPARTQDRDPGASHPTSPPASANQGSEARNTSHHRVMGDDSVPRRTRADVDAEILKLRTSEELIRLGDVMLQTPERLERASGRRPTIDDMHADRLLKQAMAARDTLMSKVGALETERDALPETPPAAVRMPQKRQLKNGLPAEGKANPKTHQVVLGALQGKSPRRVAADKTERQRQRYSLASNPAQPSKGKPQHVMILEDSEERDNAAFVEGHRKEHPDLVVLRADADNRLHPHVGEIKRGVPTVVMPKGHGRYGERTVGKRGIEDMAEQIKSLRADHDLDITDVEMPVCNAAACDQNGISIANGLQRALFRHGIDVEVSGPMGEHVLRVDGSAYERAPTGPMVKNHRTFLVQRHKQLTDEIEEAQRDGSSNAHLLEAERSKVEAEIQGLMMRMHAHAKEEMLTARTPGRTAFVEANGRLEGYALGDLSRTVMPDADGKFPRASADVNDEIRILLKRADPGVLKRTLDEAVQRLAQGLGRTPTPAEIESDPIGQRVIAKWRAYLPLLKALKSERDALLKEESALAPLRAGDPAAGEAPTQGADNKALRDFVLERPGKKALTDALAKIDIPDAELFDRIPDGRITALVMAQNGIEPDYVAMRKPQTKVFADFEHGTVRGRYANEMVHDPYDPLVGTDGIPAGRVRSAGVLLRDSNQEGLVVQLVPKDEASQLLSNPDFYAGTANCCATFPLREALERGARLYPEASSAIDEGRRTFVIAMPKNTPIPVKTHVAPKVEGIRKPEIFPAMQADRWPHNIIVLEDKGEGGATIGLGAARLEARHSETTTTAFVKPDGTLHFAFGDKINLGVPTKVYAAGHGDVEGHRVGGYSAGEIGGQLRTLRKLGVDVRELRLRSCGSLDCAEEDQRSMVDEMNRELEDWDVPPVVKGYRDTIVVDREGRAQPRAKREVASGRFGQRVVFFAQSPESMHLDPEVFRKRWAGDVAIALLEPDGRVRMDGSLWPGASAQVQVIGDVDVEAHTMGGIGPGEIAGHVGRFKQYGLDVQEVKLVGCESSKCAADGTSLGNHVAVELDVGFDMHPEVKGYDTPIHVDSEGRKRPGPRDDGAVGSDLLGKHYDQHLIVMQQNMADIGVLGANLRNKHLLKTALWQWEDDGGMFRRIAGIELEPGATTKLTLLGHGNRWFRTLGGRDGFELATQVFLLQNEHGLVIPKVYAFGCYADCEINGSSLVRDLGTALHGFGVDAEVKGPAGPIIAMPDGRKVRPDEPAPEDKHASS